ncbi:MAG: CoA ester lyase [Pseudomonadota bacterium]
MSDAIRRSALYMPGSNARALVKARALDADVIIIDLEDAVAPDAKASARILAEQAIVEGGYGPREVVLRVNALDSAWFSKDVDVVKKGKPDAVLFPKISSAKDVVAAQAALDDVDPGGGIKLWLMMETAMSVVQAGAIAGSVGIANRLSCLVVGTNDLAKETGVSANADRAYLMPWLMTYVAAAKAHGLTILDGVSNAIQETDALVRECQQGRTMGMDGKTLIHPAQIEPCNAAFSPSSHEIEEAQAIVTAFALPENAGQGVISLNGKMVELLHLEMAKKMLAVAKRLRD